MSVIKGLLMVGFIMFVLVVIAIQFFVWLVGVMA